MFSKSYFSQMLLPSNWSRKSEGTVRLHEHINIIEQCSKEVTESISSNLIIPYGTRPRERIHIIGSDLPKSSPIYIHFHGGYWQESIVTAENNLLIAKHLYNNNIKTIIVGYELCPTVTLSEIADNVEKALIICLEYAKTHETKGIFLSGHSAGGQIVAMLFKSFLPSLPVEDQSLFKKAFLLSGVFDLTAVQKSSLNDLLRLDETSALKESPLHQNLKASYCELVFVVAKYDSPKLIQQSEDMYLQTTKLGFKAEYIFLENTDHFDLIEGYNDEENVLTKLVVKYCTNK
ncbi:kynurenine formamidase [Diorhabda carinulata]|uniref:kynurenine formamidase n=1 Tax=Diorhabda carinulata TaxID=1163345 RepID=UPI0025A2A0F5|nr:kynurenine formamidase [Diorhabda carinulata]